MTHEKLKKQYEEDCKNYERPWELWEYRSPTDLTWTGHLQHPAWFLHYQYHRKEPKFQPEYFSGLNWQDAKKLVGRPIEFSNDPGYEGWKTGILESLDYNQGHRFKILHRWFYEYTRTCPETFADPHPTIRITVNGRAFDLPRPETKAPRDGTKYWAVAPMEPRGIEVSIWLDEVYDNNRLKYQAIHLTEDHAQAWADFWKKIHK
jgi:hypothetical protein